LTTLNSFSVLYTNRMGVTKVPIGIAHTLAVSVFFIRTEWVWLSIRQCVRHPRPRFSVLYTNRMGVTYEYMFSIVFPCGFQCSLYEPNGCDYILAYVMECPTWWFQCSLYEPNGCDRNGYKIVKDHKLCFSVLYTNRMGVTLCFPQSPILSS